VSGGDHCWFKRSTGEKRSVTSEDDDDDDDDDDDNDNNNNLQYFIIKRTSRKT
jgi:hypothetical protein